MGRPEKGDHFVQRCYQNMVEGAVVDGIGNALYGALTHKKGIVEQTNFNQYHIIRHNEVPKI